MFNCLGSVQFFAGNHPSDILAVGIQCQSKCQNAKNYKFSPFAQNPHHERNASQNDKGRRNKISGYNDQQNPEQKNYDSKDKIKSQQRSPGGCYSFASLKL